MTEIEWQVGRIEMIFEVFNLKYQPPFPTSIYVFPVLIKLKAERLRQLAFQIGELGMKNFSQL